MATRQTAFLIALLLMAGAILATEAVADRLPAQAEQFHRLVGGLGFGPALDLSDCVFGFDPRLDDGCAYDRGPIPGGACVCPRHAGSIFYYVKTLDP